MPARLTLYPRDHAARCLLIRDGETAVLGRDPKADIVLADARISRRHARFTWGGSGFLLEDLGSKNGTLVNGQPARSTELKHRDWISFGGVAGRFDLVSWEQARRLRDDRLGPMAEHLDVEHEVEPEHGEQEARPGGHERRHSAGGAITERARRFGATRM